MENRDDKPDGDGSSPVTCSRLVLQRRYVSKEMPQSFRQWHDHPEPHQIAWGPGLCETLEENMRRACRDFYEIGKGCEFRMVRRTDEPVWEYSANDKPCNDASKS